MPRTSIAVRRVRALEIIVPLLMLGGAALFLAGSVHLSPIALILPGVLVATIVAAVAVAVVAAFRSRATEIAGEEDDPALGAVFAAKPWLLLLLPLILTLAFDLLGALAALVLLVFFAQLIFDRGRPLRSFLIALAVTVPVYVLFAHFLYVRFPAGALGLG
jgi:hypothetical protein